MSPNVRSASFTSALAIAASLVACGKDAPKKTDTKAVENSTVEVAPKKTGVSLRRNKQFAVIEAPSATRLQLGVNLRGATPTERLRAAGGMCTHRVDVASAEEIDAELVGWLHEAYEEA